MDRDESKSNITERIAFKLKNVREALGLNIEKVCSDTQLPVEEIETGLIEITSVYTLCGYYNIDVGDFLRSLKLGSI